MMNGDDLKRDRLAGLVELNNDEVEQIEGGCWVRTVAEGTIAFGLIFGVITLEALGRVTGQR